MDDHVKELVCLAASVAGHCRPCFQYHLKKAKELGIPASDIEQVIAIAKEISSAGDKHMVEFAQLKIED
ncbi:MAG: carboxymuconolactone decarboxylase family protein [bacterium]|nr:carboxymuconolactone decarboxylase family protein [bacterium]